MKFKYDWIRKAQRCLRMLSELHRLGYQHLPGMPYFNAQGFRFAIAPRHCFPTMVLRFRQQNFLMVSGNHWCGTLCQLNRY